MHEIAVEIARVLDRAELARLVTHHARELLGADGSVLYGWDDDADGFLELSTSGTEAGRADKVLQIGQGIAVVDIPAVRTLMVAGVACEVFAFRIPAPRRSSPVTCSPRGRRPRIAECRSGGRWNRRRAAAVRRAQPRAARACARLRRV
jgi:hypothetical protein